MAKNWRICEYQHDTYRDSNYNLTPTLPSPYDFDDIKPVSPETIHKKKRRKIINQEYSPTFYEKISYEKIDDGQVSIQQLNKDCLLEIFSYCSIISKLYFRYVCKRWFNVSMESIHKCIKLDVNNLSELVPPFCFDREDFKDGYLDDCECLPKVKTFDIYCVFRIIGANLVHLILSESYINLELVAKSCPNIPVLDMTALNWEHPLHLEDNNEKDYFDLIAKRFSPKLTQLLLPSYIPFRGEFLGRVLQRAINLETLDLSVDPYRYRAEFNSVVNGASVLPKIPKIAPLRSLNLSGCYNFPEVPDPDWNNEYSHLDPSIKYWISLMTTEGMNSTVELLLNDFSESIEYLNLSKIRDVFENVPIAEIGYRNKCYELRTLVLHGFSCSENGSFSPTYDSGQLLSVLSLMPSLWVLDLTDNCDMDRDPDILSKIHEVATGIEELILDNCLLYAKNLLCLSSFQCLEKLSINKPEDDVNNAYKENHFGYTKFAKEVVPTLSNLTELSMRGTHGLYEANVYRVIMNFVSFSGVNRVITLDVNWAADVWNGLINKCHAKEVRDVRDENFSRSKLTIQLPFLPEKLVFPPKCFLTFKCLSTGRTKEYWLLPIPDGF